MKTDHVEFVYMILLYSQWMAFVPAFREVLKRQVKHMQYF